MRVQFYFYWLIVLALLAVLAQTGRAAVAFTITPNTVSNTYNGLITVQVTGLTNTETVVIQKFLDANTNGVIDGSDLLWQQYTLTDGTNFVIGGVTNNNVPGDTDGTANGQITAKLNFQSDVLQTFGGKYLVKLSSPVGHFTPITNSFTVTNFPYAQRFTGTVVSNGVAVPNAVVILFPAAQDGNPLGGCVANNSGSYTLPAPAGSYLLVPFKTNFIANFRTAPALTLSNNATFPTNLSLIVATQTISGKIVDANNSSIGLPGILTPVQTQDRSLLGTCFTDTNGNFTTRVNANQWGIGGDSAGVAFHGYVEPQNKTTVDTTTGSVSGVTIALHKATAFFYGTVKDNLGNPLPQEVAVYADDNDNGLYESDGYTDTNGNYVTAVVGGLGNSDPWYVSIDNSSSFPNYIFSQPAIDQNGGTNIGVGNAVLANFTAILATNHITGYVKDNNGNPISGVGVNVNTTTPIGGVNYQSYTDTDTNGNFSFNVPNGSWDVSVNQQGGDDSLDNILGSGNYQPPSDQNVVINNNNQAADFTVQLCDGVQIITTSLPTGVVNAPYDQFLLASSCNDNFNWSVNDPQDLPPGLQLDSFGELFGTPSTNGTFNFSVNVTDGNNNSTNQSLSLTITSPLPVLSAPVITSGHQLQLSLNGNAGNYYTIEFSTNLINWSPLLITNPPNAQPLYLDFPTTNKTGFYRGYQSGVVVGQSDFSLGVGTVGTPVFYVNVTNGVAVIPITRTNGLLTGACVNYSTSDGTAVGGCDYEPQSGTLCFAAGVSSNSISIPVSLGCSATNQSATVNLQLSNGSNVLNAVLIIQRPPPVLTVFPTSLTLYVPGNCGQSITISNAGPQGSVLNYTLADDGALGGFLNFNGQGPVSPAIGSLQAGQSSQVTITVLDQFATNWIGGNLTTAPSIHTPGAANFVKYPLSVTITPTITLSIAPISTNDLDFGKVVAGSEDTNGVNNYGGYEYGFAGDPITTYLPNESIGSPTESSSSGSASSSISLMTVTNSNSITINASASAIANYFYQVPFVQYVSAGGLISYSRYFTLPCTSGVTITGTAVVTSPTYDSQDNYGTGFGLVNGSVNVFVGSVSSQPISFNGVLQAGTYRIWVQCDASSPYYPDDFIGSTVQTTSSVSCTLTLTPITP